MSRKKRHFVILKCTIFQLRAWDRHRAHRQAAASFNASPVLVEEHNNRRNKTKGNWLTQIQLEDDSENGSGGG